MKRSCLVLAVVATVLVSGEVRGYGGDTHYYLRFAQALETCFTWDEAHVIASADYLVDKNGTTTAEKHPAKKHNKVNWHAFGRDEERFNVLWERVAAETDPELKLVKLGQFLHFASDWESHYGYGVRMGHGIPTLFARDPDSLGNNRLNNIRMTDQTMYQMLAVCAGLGRLERWDNDPDRALVGILEDFVDVKFMQELFETNTPRWKKWGKRWKMGKKILARNHLLVEELIAERAADRPERKIPDDFTPGDPERGLPPPLGVRYDADGELMEVLGPELELLPEFAGSPLTESEREAFEEAVETDLVDDLEDEVQDGADLDLHVNVEIRLEEADLLDDGWRLDVDYMNYGTRASEPTFLDVFVLDVSTEELLAQSRVAVPAIPGDTLVETEVVVPAGGKPNKRVLVGASLELADLSADNNNVWFLPWPGTIDAGAKKRKKSKMKRETGTVDFIGEPNVWIGENGDAYFMVTAWVSGGDSARRLGRVQFKTGDVTLETWADEDLWWFAVPDVKRRVVLARAPFWILAEDVCAAVGRGGATYELAVSGGDIVPSSASYTWPPGLRDEVLNSCSTRDEKNRADRD